MACLRALLPAVARKIHSHSIIGSIYTVVSELILGCTQSLATDVQLIIDLKALSLALVSDRFTCPESLIDQSDLDSGYLNGSESGLASLASTSAYVFLVTPGQVQSKCVGRSFDQSTLDEYLRHFHLQASAAHTVVFVCRLFHELPLRARMTREIRRKHIVREIKKTLFLALVLSAPLNLSVKFVNEDPWLVVPPAQSINSLYESIFERNSTRNYTIELDPLVVHVFCAEGYKGEASFHIVEWLGHLVELTKHEQRALLKALKTGSSEARLNFIIQVECLTPAENPTFTFSGLLELINRICDGSHGTKSLQNTTVALKWHLDYCKQSDFFQSKVLVDIHAFQSAKVVAQIENLFILVTMGRQSFLIDQHACDERIRYEALLRDFVEKTASPSVDLKVRLDERVDFGVTDSEMQALSEFKEFYSSCGIVYQLQNGRCHVTHLPYCMRNLTAQDCDLSSSLLSYAIESEHPHVFMQDDWFLQVKHLPRCISKCLALAACRLSITFAQRLEIPEIQYLINSLALCKSPFRCAHGRPTIKPMANAIITTFNDDLQP